MRHGDGKVCAASLIMEDLEMTKNASVMEMKKKKERNQDAYLLSMIWPKRLQQWLKNTKNFLSFIFVRHPSPSATSVVVIPAHGHRNLKEPMVLGLIITDSSISRQKCSGVMMITVVNSLYTLYLSVRNIVL